MTSTPTTSERPMEFEQRLEALLPKMYAHAAVITKSEDGADELVQDTCVRALSHFHQWHQGRGRFDGWIGAIMQSTWANACRDGRYREMYEGDLPDPDLVIDGNLESEIMRQLMLADIRRLCRTTLSDEDFSLVIRIHIYGYTYRDLADEAGCPIGTILTRVRRAKATLLKAARKGTVKSKPPTLAAPIGERRPEYA